MKLEPNFWTDLARIGDGTSMERSGHLVKKHQHEMLEADVQDLKMETDIDDTVEK